jgi:hypothetical protein
MKNQNDMIIAIVAIVLGLIGFAVAFFTQRDVNPVPPPEQVVTSDPVLQGADVRMANSLPAAANQNDPFTGGGTGGGGGAARGGGGGAFGGDRPTAAGAGGGSTAAGGGNNNGFNPNVPTAAGAGGGGGG